MFSIMYEASQLVDHDNLKQANTPIVRTVYQELAVGCVCNGNYFKGMCLQVQLWQLRLQLQQR